MDPTLLLVLFAIAVVSACFDAMAGGGGLLTVPALLIAGLDPVAAIATNKLQGAAGAVSATLAFARRGLIEWRIGVPLAVVAGLASVAGARSITLLPRTVLDALVPLLLAGAAMYFALSRKMGEEDRAARMPLPAFAATVVPLVGFYDGVFGPGAGSFYTIGFVGLCGFGLVRATAHTKLANAASNAGSLALYALSGAVRWDVGLTMAVGALLGAQVGSRLALRGGAGLIRPLLVLISGAVAVRMLADPANPLRPAVAGLWGG